MRLSVLLIEPDLSTLDIMADMVTALGHRAIGVLTTAMAIGALQAIKVDVAIIGLAPDDPDGIAIAALAKSHQPGIKTVVSSGKHVSRIAMPTIDAFLNKPFSIDDMRKTLQALYPGDR